VANAETIILYVLSTFAQTCAALAAFVGAVGLFRLETLARRLEAMYHDIHAIIGMPPVTREEVLQLDKIRFFRRRYSLAYSDSTVVASPPTPQA